MSEQKLELVAPSSLENIDYAIYDWLDKQLNLHCNSRDGFKKVPTLWVTPERSFQIKNSKDFRDVNGTLELPLITIERGAIVKDQKNAATFYANLPPKDNRLLISRKINQKKTSEFANADYKRKYGEVDFVKPRKQNPKIVYQYKSVYLPVYVQLNYSISIFTQYQQQMNELIQPFATKTGSTRYFLIEKDGYKYECFIEPNFDIRNNINGMDEEERRYITTITIKTLGNIQTDGVNESDSVTKVYENPVEIKLPRENVILQIEPETQPKNVLPILGPNAGRQLSSNVAIKKIFSIGNGTDSVYTVAHNLNTRDMYISVRENFGPDFSQVTVGITYDTLDQVSIDMGDIIATDSYIVTIIG